MSLNILHLYRPRLPSNRAQSIQVLGTCHALAGRGHRVTLLADPPADHMPVDEIPSVSEILDFYDLPPVEGLDLRVAPTSKPTWMSFWFRKHVMGWVWESRQSERRSVVLARAKRYFDEYTMLPFAPKVVMEAHEVDSRAPGLTQDPDKKLLKLEARLLLLAEGLITNCAGTLELLRDTHGELLPPNSRVVYNATNPRRVRDHRPGARRVIGYAGSLKTYKGLQTLLEAAAELPPEVTLEVIGGGADRSLGELPPQVHALGEVPYRDVPDILARWSAAVLPLDDDLFGAHICNPLKLWDYLAVGLPVVAADVPTLREVLRPEQPHWYVPGDASSLLAAMLEASGHHWRRPGRQRYLRSWGTRAMELESILQTAAS